MIYEGVCKYCGRAEKVTASSQIEAYDLVTSVCQCNGARKERRRKWMLRDVLLVAKGESRSVVGLLADAGDAILNGEATALSLRVGSTWYTALAKGDRIEFSRQELK